MEYMRATQGHPVRNRDGYVTNIDRVYGNILQTSVVWGLGSSRWWGQDTGVAPIQPSTLTRTRTL